MKTKLTKKEKLAAKFIAMSVGQYACHSDRIYHNDGEYLKVPYLSIETAAKQLVKHLDEHPV